MSRVLSFYYDIRLDFSAPVWEHSFLLRCLPPSLPGQQVLEASLELEPQVGYVTQQDSFGNSLQIGRIDPPHSSFRYTSRGRVLMDHSARQGEGCLPVYRFPSALTQPDGAMADWLRSLSLPEDPHERVWALAKAVHDRMSYSPGMTGTGTTAAQAFQAGQGVCQDFAHIYLALARLSGLPARYVSGLPEGEGASHAWCQVWLDGKWLGIDPTRLQWEDEGYIRFGAGRDFGDCPIERGVFLGSAWQSQSVFMQVTRE